MFNGMMDPELIKLAQEQMSRMSPDEFARIQQQMMSNPELLRMATDGMKNLRPDDFKHAAEQLKHTHPEEMAEFGKKIANSTPEELASMRARADALMTYEINAAEMLKKKGNELHNQGKFSEAAEKYLLAKKNLQNVISSKGRTLMLACSLNLMSCYLKTRCFDKCIKEGTEVLAQDDKNVKALYRRGQAFKELGKLQDAVSDLSKALEVSPDDETIASILRDTKEVMISSGTNASKGLVIEEIIEDSSSNGESSIHSVSQEEGNNHCFKSEIAVPDDSLPAKSEGVGALRNGPESIGSSETLGSFVDAESLSAPSDGQYESISPDMIKSASNLIGKMSPEELQKMLSMASSFQGQNPYLKRGSSGFNSGSVPLDVTPDMLKMASDFMSKMSPEEIQKMFEMASSLKGKDSVSEGQGLRHQKTSSFDTRNCDTRENFAINNDTAGASSSIPQTAPLSRFSASSADVQEQMRNRMNDPAMRQMFSSMIKNLSPEMMTNMSERYGIKLSREDAEKAQQVMSSLSPEDLDRMMKWANRIQSGIEGAKKTKNWLLGRQGLILAILMLLVAFIFRWLGYIG